MPALSFEQIRERLAARFGDAVGPTAAAKDPFVAVKGEKLVEVSRFLRDDPELAFDYLIDVAGVDYPKENLIRVVYHVQSLSLKHTFKLKVECDRASPRVPTVDGVWHAANWLEREVYDLFGVEFEGHPDLRRILLPDDWQGHPLRKDWKEFGGYHGIGNERRSTVDRLLEQDKAARAAAPKPAPPAASEAKSAPAPAPPSPAAQGLASAAAAAPAAPPSAPEPPADAKGAEPRPAGEQAPEVRPPKAS
jgi:NADH-quinone oxidoreductase subunit C